MSILTKEEICKLLVGTGVLGQLKQDDKHYFVSV